MAEVPIEALQEAIRNLHGSESEWVEAVPVTEELEGQIVWTGTVEVFDLLNHPTAKRCYAWSYPTEGSKRRFLAVLHQGSVDSPRAAVQAVIIKDEEDA